MKIRPLLLGPAQRDDIAAVIAHAEGNRVACSTLKALVKLFETDPAAAAEEAIGSDPGLRCELPIGYRVAFSIEDHGAPRRWCRHLSISVAQDGMFPGPAAVQEIALAFGFRGTVAAWAAEGTTWIEGGHAINVIESMEPQPA